MPTYFKAKDLLLAKFNAANALSLTHDQVEWGLPIPAENVDLVKSKTFNTAVSLKMLPGAERTGTIILFYNRVDLNREFASFTSLQKDFIPVMDIASMSEAVPFLEAKLGLRLDPSEVIDTPITMKNDYVLTDLIIKDNSYEYVGKVPIRLYNGTASTIANVRYSKIAWAESFREINYAASYAQTNVVDYTAAVARTDYTPIANILSAIRAYGGYGASNLTELDGHMLCYDSGLATMLASVDGIPWVFNSAKVAGPNTYRANYLYNGSTSDFNAMAGENWLYTHATFRAAWDAFISSEIRPGKLVDESFDRVLVIAMDWPWMTSTGKHFIFFFHYNVGDTNDYTLRYR